MTPELADLSRRLVAAIPDLWAPGMLAQFPDGAVHRVGMCPGRSRKTLERVARGRATLGDRFVMPYYSRGSGLTGRSLGRPLGTVTTRDRWGVVDGDRMRMLLLDEYRAAMGFPAGYHVPSTPKALGVHLLGNAVCPPVVADVLEALEAA